MCVSNTVYTIELDKYLVYKKVPKSIRTRTKENMEIYNLDLYDSFKEAVCHLAKKGSKLHKAWWYDDFREYIPCAYTKESLDFISNPLKYI